MSLKYGLLGLLSYNPMTGYELDKVFKDSLSLFWQAKTSQIYRELDAMEKLGWLISEHVIQTDKPNKRVYSLTDTGKREFLTWLSDPETDIIESMRVKNAFLMRVFFAGETSKEEALRLIRSYREKCLAGVQRIGAVREIITQYGQALGSGENALYWDLTVLYEEELYKADVAWADKAIAILEATGE